MFLAFQSEIKNRWHCPFKEVRSETSFVNQLCQVRNIEYGDQKCLTFISFCSIWSGNVVDLKIAQAIFTKCNAAGQIIYNVCLFWNLFIRKYCMLLCLQCSWFLPFTDLNSPILQEHFVFSIRYFEFSCGNDLISFWLLPLNTAVKRDVLEYVTLPS